MSQLRMGRNPDGTRQIVLDSPGRGRVAGYGQGNLHSLTLIGGPRSFGDDTVGGAPENQGVKPTETRRFRR